MSAGAGAAEVRRGRSFAGLFLVTFCALAAIGSVLPIIPRYVRGPLDFGDVAVGVVIGSYALTGLLLRPFAGRLADRRGRKPTVLLGISGVALGGLLYLPSLGLAGLLAARLLVGAGEGTLYTAGSAWIVDLAPVARRGRVLGLYGLAVWGGLSVGPLAGELIYNAGGYDAVWIFAAALPMVGALLATTIPDPFRPQAQVAPHPLIAPEAIRPGVAIALAATGYAVVATFIVLHLEARGINQGATVFAAFAAAIVLVRLVAGDLPDRLGSGRVAAVAGLFEAAGLVVLAFAQSLPVALLGGMMIGGAISLMNPSLMLVAVGRVSAEARGAAMGTYTAFFDGGIGIGAPLAGVVAALSSYEGAFLCAAGLSLASAAMVFATMRDPATPSVR